MRKNELDKQRNEKLKGYNNLKLATKESSEEKNQYLNITALIQCKMLINSNRLNNHSPFLHSCRCPSLVVIPYFIVT